MELPPRRARRGEAPGGEERNKNVSVFVINIPYSIYATPKKTNSPMCLPWRMQGMDSEKTRNSTSGKTYSKFKMDDEEEKRDIYRPRGQE